MSRDLPNAFSGRRAPSADQLGMAWRRFERQLRALPRQRTQLLPALLLAQAAFGYVSDQAVEQIAAHLRLTPHAVEGVATSYPELRRQPSGAHVVRVCTGVSCWTAGSDQLLVTVAAMLGVQGGASGADSPVSVEEVPCCFLCAVAPVVEIDGICHGRASVERVRALVAAIGLASFRSEPGGGR